MDEKLIIYKGCGKCEAFSKTLKIPNIFIGCGNPNDFQNLENGFYFLCLWKFLLILNLNIYIV